MLKNLRILRLEKKLTQEQLGKMIGVSQQNINSYENHDVVPELTNLMKLAEYFEVSVDFLIGYTTIRHKYEELTSCDLNNEELKFVNVFKKISPKMRRALYTILLGLAEQ